MYKYKKFTTLSEQTSEIIVRDADGAFIPLDLLNSDYNKMLDDVIEHGIEVIEGEDIPSFILEQAQARNFDKQVIQYRKALARISRYALAEGRPEIKQSVPSLDTEYNPETGEYEPVMVEVVTQTAVDPLPEFVTIFEKDEEGNVVESTVRNPAIVQDEIDRAVAQAIVDATPQEVKDAAK